MSIRVQIKTVGWLEFYLVLGYQHFFGIPISLLTVNQQIAMLGVSFRVSVNLWSKDLLGLSSDPKFIVTSPFKRW